MNLALFFTYGISLKTWVETGLIDREKLVYEEHLKSGNLRKVFWFTYNSDDKKYERELKETSRLHKDIDVIALPRIFNNSIGKVIYSFLLPIIYGKFLKGITILKTNQINGSWSAVFAKWLYKKPLVIRTGYTASLFAKNQSKSWLKIRIYELTESFAYKYCDIGFVASRSDKEFICQRYHIAQDKIKVLNNYVDTDFFYPKECEKYKDRIIFVGRLTEQKNLHNLVKAISKTGLTLDIYGGGELKEDIYSLVKTLGVHVNFMGIVQNSKMPEILNKYNYYILPSFYEGMPKSLLEAMACGLVCIGTNVRGINEVIEDMKTGYLSYGIDEISIADAINRAINNDKNIIKVDAVKKIRESFSLRSITEKESRIFNELIQAKYVI